MNFAGWGLWGFVGTVVLTLGMAASQHFGLTRMSLPYLLGTTVTPDRDRAKIAGLLIHFFDGWAFSLLYVAAFESWQKAGWIRGMGIGLIHALFVLTVILPSLPGLHPRMASSSTGPEMTEHLEPPGFWGLNYGLQTPVVVLAAHLAFGAILGYGYRPTTHTEGGNQRCEPGLAQARTAGYPTTKYPFSSSDRTAWAVSRSVWRL